MTNGSGTIAFFVRGIPQSQPRARARAIRGKDGAVHARVHNPLGRSADWKSLIAIEARKHLPDTAIDGPVELGLLFHLPRPKSHFRSGRHAGELKASAPRWHTAGGRHDVDNLAKAVMDQLTLIGAWRDDSQVAVCYIRKEYAEGTPGMNVCINQLTSDNPDVYGDGYGRLRTDEDNADDRAHERAVARRAAGKRGRCPPDSGRAGAAGGL